MKRRLVRTSTSFFEQLDDQLGASRGPRGEPSATDFLVFELPAIVEAFATLFDELPEAVEGFSQARMVVGSGRLVRAYAVHGLLLDDGAVELIGVEVDLGG